MIPAHTIAGQLATFIDKGEGGLGLSYHEALDEIPYELILLMQRDKSHIASDDVLVEEEDETKYFRDHGIKLR